MRTLALALLSIAFSVAAQFFLKAGMAALTTSQATAAGMSSRLLLAMASQPAIVMGFVLYGLGALVWLSVLAHWDVSKAYPLVGLGFVGTLLIGYLLGEHVTAVRLIGVMLICCGVVLVSRS